jgi:hypothetical protein
VIAMISFDTCASVKRLTATGMSEAPAEAITELVSASRDANFSVFATKADLQHEIVLLRSDLKQEIAEVRRDLPQQITSLRGEKPTLIAETKSEILKRMIGLVAGVVLINIMAMVGAILAVVRIGGH